MYAQVSLIQKARHTVHKTYVNDRSFPQPCPVKRRVQVVVCLRVPGRAALHALGKPSLPPALVLALAVVGNKIPVGLARGESKGTPNGRVGGLFAVPAGSQGLHQLRIGFPDLIQVEGDPVAEDRVAQEGSRGPGVRYIAGTRLAEDARGHGMSENAMHAVLGEPDLLGNFGVGHLAVQRDKLGDVEIHNDVQRREVVLDLVDSISFLIVHSYADHIGTYSI